MSNAVNIPKIFASTWEKLLEKELNIGKTASRKFDAELKKGGDTVSVPIGFDVKVDTSYKGDAVVAKEKVNSTSVEIKIDKGGSFNFEMTEADYLQVVNSPQLLGDSVKRAIYKCRNEMDAALGLLYSDAGIIGDDSAVTVTTSNAYEILMHMNYLMDEGFVEKEDRFAILPSRFWSYIKGEIKTNYDTTEAFKIFGAGYAGKVDNLNIILSENVYNSGGTYQPLFGVMGQSYALAVQKEPQVVEYMPEASLNHAYKGGYLFGVKTVRGDKLGTIPLTIPSILGA